MSHYQKRDKHGRIVAQVQSSGGKVSLFQHDHATYKAGIACLVDDPAEMRKFFEAGLLACDEAEENR